MHRGGSSLATQRDSFESTTCCRCSRPGHRRHLRLGLVLDQRDGLVPPAGIRGPGYPARGSRGRLSCKQHNIYTLETFFKSFFVKSTRICTPTEHFILFTLRSRPILRRKKCSSVGSLDNLFFTIFKTSWSF